MKTVKRGDIWMVELLEDNYKHMLKNLHPCLVISNNRANKFSTIVQVVPISSKERSLPCHVKLDYKSCNLDKPSILLTEQITSVNIENLKYMVGRIGYEDMLNAERVVSKQIGISNVDYDLEIFEKLRTMLNELEELDRFLGKRNNEQAIEEREDLLKDISRFCVTYSIKIDIEKYKYKGCNKDVKAAV